VSRRLFSVIPAAGQSRRMGVPKLLLELNGITLIERLINTLTQPAVSGPFILVRPDDVALQAVIQSTTATAVVPDSPPLDMRTSVELLIAEIEQRFHPDPEDGWMLCPGDMPLLDSASVNRVIERWQALAAGADSQTIVVAQHGSLRGHPVIFPWSMASEVASLPENEGLNMLVRRAEQVLEVPCASSLILKDVDTPEDWIQVRRELESN